MELQAYFLCTAARVTSGGLLDIRGAGLSIVRAAPHNKYSIECIIVCRFFKEPTEIGEKSVAFKLIDADGKQIGKARKHIMHLNPDIAGAEVIANFSGNFPPGEYSIELFLDNKRVAAHPLRVVQTQDTN